jgi:hypothetical protein
MRSGLYATLVEAGLMIPHDEVDAGYAVSDGAYRVIRPEHVEFISYPYEWCFSQLKDAALTTLAIQRTAMDHDMSLRDASAYNIQFHRGRPMLIDTLSFEKLREGAPWVAYRQFCQHFLAPLALISYRDARLGQLSRIHIDGIPIDLAVALLPMRARFRLPLLMHIFLHARSQRRQARAPASGRTTDRPFTLRAFRGLIDSLTAGVRKLRWQPGPSVWAGYYAEAPSYTPEALDHKRSLVAAFIQEAGPKHVWDLGANTGMFSRLASDMGISTISFDMDPAAVEESYLRMAAESETEVLPLIMDLTNPSPGIGWENRERLSLLERKSADMALALALIHHLVIGNNVPMDRLAGFMKGLCEWLAVEFVPKSDPMVQTLLATREDVFPDYTQEGFEKAFEAEFAIERREPIRGSQRILYLMRGRRSDGR